MGLSDGTLGQRRFFEAEPFTSVFVSAEKLTLYDEEVPTKKLARSSLV
jgi:hypothetical protein